MAIVLRTIKGLPLSYAEMDNNFAELETRIEEIAQSNVASINGLSGNVYITTAEINEGNVNLYYTDLRVDTRLATKNSDFFQEGSQNLYYSNARVDARIATTTTDALAEGLTNKYFTNARARSAISSGSSGLTYDSGTGVFSLSTLTTTNVGEGTNLYYTNTRVDTRLAASSINALADVDTVDTTPVDNYVLTWNSTFSKWIPAPVNFVGAGLGETNTASNVGTGQGLYATKVGYDLRFYSLAGSNGVSISAPASNVLTISNQQDISTSASVLFANVNVSSTLTAANISVTTGDLEISNAGVGNVNLTAGAINVESSNLIVGTGSGPAMVSTIGSHNLVLNTTLGLASSEITIAAGSNGNISLTPAGTGQVVSSGIVNATQFVSNVTTGTAPFTVTSTTQVANLNVAASGTAVTVTGAAQPNITSLGNLTTANIGTIGSAINNGNINLTPNGTGEVVIASLSVSDLTATRVPYSGTNGSQIDSANLTFSGTQLTVTGTVNATVLAAGNLSMATNSISAVNADGNVTLTPLGTGKVIAAGAGLSASTITSTGATVLGTTSADTITFNGSLTSTVVPQSSNSIDIGSTSFKFRAGYFTANVACDGAIRGGTLVSNVTTGTAPLTVTSTTQVANLNVATSGSVINGTSNIQIAANSNVTVGVAGAANILTVTATGAVVAGTVDSSSTITGTRLISNIATGTAPLTVSSTTRVANLNVATAGAADTATSATTAGTVTTAAQPNITSVGTLAGLAVSSTVYPTTNGTVNLGGASNYWAIIYGTATTARYADLAERYESDIAYGPGTVLVFGGDKEVTTTDKEADVSVAGVVSTAPAYLMNDINQNGDTHPPVALRGKVPVKVVGYVNKGDLLITSSWPGYAMSAGKIDRGAAVFAKALENKTDDIAGIVWAVII